MRIGLLNPTILLRRPIVELAGELEARGHEVTVLTPTDSRSKWQPSHFENSRLKVIGLPSREIRSLLWAVPLLGTFSRLWRAMKQYDVIQIWAPYYVQAILPLVYSFFMRTRPKIILTFDTFPGYSFFFDSMVDRLMRIYQQTIGRLLFQRADVITLYGQQLRTFAEQLHLPEKKITDIPTGIRYRPQITDHQVGQKFEVLFIGLMNRRKGVALLLESLETLIRKHPAVHATLVGDGPERQEFEAMAKRLDLGPVVKFTGRTNNVEQYYLQANVLVLPSYGEGLPGVVMEAMNYGVPVITTDIPCLRELIPTLSEGILIPIDDSQAITKALERLITDHGLGHRHAQAAHKHIANFSWSRVVPQYEKIYGLA